MQLRPAHDPRLGDPGLFRPAPVLLDERGLAPEVRQNPFGYVAQEIIEPASLDPTVKRSTPFHLSAFVIAQGREFTVLPGGLVHPGTDLPSNNRVRVTADALVLRHVLGDKPASSKTPADAGTPTAGNDNP